MDRPTTTETEMNNAGAASADAVPSPGLMVLTKVDATTASGSGSGSGGSLDNNDVKKNLVNRLSISSAVTKKSDSGNMNMDSSCTMSVKRHKEIFENNYNEIVSYFDEDSGCLCLPKGDVNAKRLRNWFYRQRERKNLTDEEFEKISNLSNYFDIDGPSHQNDIKWDVFFRRLHEYWKDHHTFVISKKDFANKDLRDWVIRQRRAARDGTLPRWRESKLVGLAGNDFLRCFAPRGMCKK